MIPLRLWPIVLILAFASGYFGMALLHLRGDGAQQSRDATPDARLRGSHPD